MQRPEPLQLLDLPFELLQLILLHCSTPSFLQFSLTCSTVYAAASSCREVILNHLYKTPGLKTSLDTLPTEELHRILKARTAEHLYGANFHSDLTNYIFKTGIIDTRASALREGKDPNAALVEKGGDRVLVYHVQSGEVALREILEAPYDYPGRVEIIKVVFCKDESIAVLQRYEPFEELDPSECVDALSAKGPHKAAGVYLVIYRRDFGPGKPPRVTFGEFEGVQGFYPTAIAIRDINMVVIAWQHERFAERRRVFVHTLFPEETVHENGISCHIDVTYYTTILGNEICKCPGADQFDLTPPNFASVVRLDLNDDASQLLFYHPASTIYNKFLKLEPLNSTEGQPNRPANNTCRANFSGHSLLFSIAIPFYCTHETYRPHANHEMCHWKYLALGIASNPSPPWTIACLLRSQAHCRASHCRHIPNLDRGRRFDQWTVMARLWGYQKRNDSLSGVVATSAQGKRLAIANWNVIYVWALNPAVIIEGEQGEQWEYYPEQMKSRDDVVELKPVILKPDAVCFSLKFSTCEDELIALTDKGLMRWDLGPARRGFRVKKFLDMGEKRRLGESSQGADLADVNKCQDVEMSGV
ncbi:hypothetical protein PRK78_004897 [Emydomyces testavorans]|uniref:F-box domain-containing protein n=1 Tax=Emydomyces testavorans TaxID=2070801 RepID=A0AAF0IJ08_9EURO|nr:hypothetical protein PRK78_004897 [Emydomyces testavorans]